MYDRNTPVDYGGREPSSVGMRIREFRAIRDFSLAELGRRAHVSTGHLSRVESGDRHASPAVVAAVARALGVPISVLHGQPYIHILQKDQLDALLTPISSALDSWDIPLEENVPTDSLDELAAKVAQASRRRASGNFAAAAEALPELITATATAVQIHSAPGADRERAYYLQAEVARTTAIVAYRLGYMDLARLALARMAVAAPQSGDPRQVAIERYERAQMTHAETARPDRGVALMRLALRDLVNDGEPATAAVRGTLLLRAATLSAVQHDQAATESWLGEAEDLAEASARQHEQENPPGSRYALAFGQLNVTLGQMDAAIHGDDHDAALRWAEMVQMPEDYQPTRVAGFWIRRAESFAWTARHSQALQSLQEARRIAPQLTRYHPNVHETVATLLRARQRATDSLRDFAQWSGV
ncbi:helix-turn-helix transcriptional regulator [Streptosporangium sp. NPDC051023]|uniref:helix-turn-helix domain-containing protein n=1 Tax=Streptosporangium sp. NPDC051023 TaxID=3155410 RepID=UPI00344E4513